MSSFQVDVWKEIVEINSMVQICRKCNIEKMIEEFCFKSRIDNVRHKHCRECQRLYKRKHYENHTESYKERSKISKAVYVLRNRDYVREYLKSHGCVDCRCDDWEVLDFDHVQDKSWNVSELVMNACSIEKIQAEINKCVVRCANCHRRKTRTQLGWS